MNTVKAFKKRSDPIKDTTKRKENLENAPGQVFVKCSGARHSSMVVSLDIAKNCARFYEHIAQHLYRRVLPANVDIQIRCNGYTLRDHREVQNGDTLYLSTVKQGLQGGSSTKVQQEPSVELANLADEEEKEEEEEK